MEKDETLIPKKRVYVHFWHPDGSFLLDREDTDEDVHEFSELLRKIAYAPTLRKKASLYPQLRKILVPPPDATSDEEVKDFYQYAIFIISTMTSIVPPEAAAENVPANLLHRPMTLQLNGNAFVLCAYSTDPENPLLSIHDVEQGAEEAKAATDSTQTPSEPLEEGLTTAPSSCLPARETAPRPNKKRRLEQMEKFDAMRKQAEEERQLAKLSLWRTRRTTIAIRSKATASRSSTSRADDLLLAAATNAQAQGSLAGARAVDSLKKTRRQSQAPSTQSQAPSTHLRPSLY